MRIDVHGALVGSDCLLELALLFQEGAKLEVLLSVLRLFSQQLLQGSGYRIGFLHPHAIGAGFRAVVTGCQDWAHTGRNRRVTDAFLPLIHTDARGVALLLLLERRLFPRAIAILTWPFHGSGLKQLKLLSVHVLLSYYWQDTQTNVIRRGLWSGAPAYPSNGRDGLPRVSALPVTPEPLPLP